MYVIINYIGAREILIFPSETTILYFTARRPNTNLNTIENIIQQFIISSFWKFSSAQLSCKMCVLVINGITDLVFWNIENKSRITKQRRKSRKTGNIGCTIHKTKNNKAKKKNQHIMCWTPPYANKHIYFYVEIVTYIRTRNSGRKDIHA